MVLKGNVHHRIKVTVQHSILLFNDMCKSYKIYTSITCSYMLVIGANSIGNLGGGSDIFIVMICSEFIIVFCLMLQ